MQQPFPSCDHWQMLAKVEKTLVSCYFYEITYLYLCIPLIKCIITHTGAHIDRCHCSCVRRSRARWRAGTQTRSKQVSALLFIFQLYCQPREHLMSTSGNIPISVGTCLCEKLRQLITHAQAYFGRSANSFATCASSTLLLQSIRIRKYEIGCKSPLIGQPQATYFTPRGSPRIPSKLSQLRECASVFNNFPDILRTSTVMGM